MSDDSSDKENDALPQSNRVKAAIKTLSDIQTALITKESIINNIMLLMRQVHGTFDTSFLSTHLINPILSSNQATRFKAISALSILVQPSSPILIDFAPLLLLTLDSPNLLPHTLKCFSSVINNRKLFCFFKDKIIELCETSTIYIRKLCIHLLFSAYLNDDSLLLPLFRLTTQSLCDFPLTSLSILLEISNLHPELVSRVFPLLLTFMNSECDSDHYYKLCLIFKNLILYDVSYSKPLIEIISTNSTFSESQYFLSTIQLISTFPNSDTLVQQFGQKLEFFAKFTQNQNQAYTIISTYNTIQDKYTPTPNFFKRLSLSTDPTIRAISYKHLSESPDLIRQIVGELISRESISSSPYLVELSLDIAPKIGSWFVTLLFNVHDLKMQSIYPLLRKVINHIEDKQTKLLFISEAKYYLPELPDDDFGIALAELIAEESSDLKDTYSLISLNLNLKSVKFQVAMLDSVFNMVLKLSKNKNETLLLNRFESLCSSSYREVRQRAAEMVYLMNEMENMEN
ncbi:hypothetical protein GPJ56_007340 [Histomonas meleagridis]|uniref:uncharacterized protein n=1 Tax=Histomonas meleagridis TaxID=135588 RepID=UPI003559AC22|nr:hypothetical protein GPJ56_007340 [Histomonas meleagridis]KAH0804186.1 hypothetical protein GO595_003016 [Histomonas meleagridis]